MERVKRSKVTVQQYAQWRFESDKSIGLFSQQATFDNLPHDEKTIILDEAHEYINGGRRNDWPLDMLERIEEDEFNGTTSKPNAEPTKDVE